MAKLVILNTPLGPKTPLRPELAAYKNPVPFLRPKAGAKFAADMFNAAGGPYAMTRAIADAYAGGVFGSGASGGLQHAGTAEQPIVPARHGHRMPHPARPTHRPPRLPCPAPGPPPRSPL